MRSRHLGSIRCPFCAGRASQARNLGWRSAGAACRWEKEQGFSAREVEGSSARREIASLHPLWVHDPRPARQLRGERARVVGKEGKGERVAGVAPGIHGGGALPLSSCSCSIDLRFLRRRRRFTPPIRSSFRFSIDLRLRLVLPYGSLSIHAFN